MKILIVYIYIYTNGHNLVLLSPVLLTLQKVLQASRIGLYPVQRHKFPEKRKPFIHARMCTANGSRTYLHIKKWQYLPARAAIICSEVGSGWFLSKVYMDMTIPGEQKPHWEPWHLASLSCNGTAQTALLPAHTTINELPLKREMPY